MSQPNRATHPASSPPLACIATHLLPFETIGLMCERGRDGRTFCNMPLLGVEGGLPREPEWGRPSAGGFMLSLSLLLNVLHSPQENQGPLYPLLTENYRSLQPSFLTLSDGTRITPWESHLAKKFSARYIEGHDDPDTLTMSLPQILERFACLARETWPDRPSAPSTST